MGTGTFYPEKTKFFSGLKVPVPRVPTITTLSPCWSSGGWSVWVLQRVKYVTTHFFENQKYEIKAIKVVLELFNFAKQSCYM